MVYRYTVKDNQKPAALLVQCRRSLALSLQFRVLLFHGEGLCRLSGEFLALVHVGLVHPEHVVAGGEYVLDAVRGRIRSGLRFTSDVVAVTSLPPDAPTIADVRDWS